MSATKKPKRVVSPYRLYRQTVPNLGKMLNRWKAQYEKCPAEDTGMLAFWTELGLKISREVREVLKADVELRLKAHELRKLDMMEAETDEVERMLSRYIKRRGRRPGRGA